MNSTSVMTARDALVEMSRVVYALVLREVATRFGEQKLGYLWAILEPILVMSILIILFSYRRSPGIPGVGVGMFYMSGLMPFLMFRHCMSRVMSSIEGNKSLLVYPQVQFLDLALARFILEVATSLLVFVILVVALQLSGWEKVSIQNPLGVLAGFLMLASFGFGLGMILGALVPLFPSVDPISQAFLGRPLFFVSGVFFTADMMPPELRTTLLYNPLLQVSEFIRYSLFAEYNKHYFDMGYTLAFLGGILFLGLLMLRALREEILRR